VEPSWRNKDQFIRDHLQEVFMLDALESSHPISVPVEHTDQIREIFDRVSYCKGVFTLYTIYEQFVALISGEGYCYCFL
jgi:aminopeptidase N